MDPTVKITRILVPSDYSLASQIACRLAARLANFLKADLVIFHAIPRAELFHEVRRPGKRTQVEFVDAVRTHVHMWFEAAVPAELRGFLPVDFRVKVGEPIPGIARAVRRTGADLVLMATQGRTGLSHFLLGSVTEAVLRSIPVPVLALRLGQGEHSLTAVRRILWATDLSSVSEGAWRYAVTLAGVFDAEVVLLHAVQPAEMAAFADHPVSRPAHSVEHYMIRIEEELERRRQGLEALRLRARRKIVVGFPTETIVGQARAEQADLIVMGTHGRTGLPHAILGSVAAGVIRKAPCPVLAVKVSRDGHTKERGTDGIAA